MPFPHLPHRQRLLLLPLLPLLPLHRFTAAPLLPLLRKGKEMPFSAWVPPFLPSWLMAVLEFMYSLAIGEAKILIGVAGAALAEDYL